MKLLKSIGLFIFLIWGSLSISPAVSNNAQVVLSGVSVKDISLSGKQINAVYSVLKKENEKISKYKIFLHFPDGVTVKEVNYKSMGVIVDKKKIWQEAYAQGRSGSWLEKVKVRWRLKRKGVKLPLYLTINQEVAKNVLEERGAPWYTKAEDARFIVTAHNEVLIEPEKVGEGIAIETALLSLQKELIVNFERDLHLYLCLEKIQPDKVSQDLEKYRISSLLSSFSTQFNAVNVKRTNNIKIAVQELDLFLLSPGEVFSFNEVVGPRTKERGYEEADVIQNYTVVPGLGGGVCQVSSTLYNAVLLADLEVVERYPHSIVISYVQPGLDATVVYGSRDFRFKNNSEGYLLIKAGVYQGVLFCKIFSPPEQKKTVVLKTFLERLVQPAKIYQEDSGVPKGEYVLERKGIPGRVVRVERYVYDNNGILIKNEIVAKDFYPPVDEVIRSSTNLESMSISEVL